MNWLAFIVGALATFRLSVLVVDDDISSRFRDAMGYWAFTSALVSCIACTSVWIGTVITVGVWLWPDVLFWLLLPFALSAIALLLDRTS